MLWLYLMLVPVTSLSQRERITVFRGNVMQKTLILLCPRLKSPQQSWTVKNDRSKTDSRLVHCHQAATKKEALASFLSNKKSLFKWVLHNAPFAEKRAPSWSPLSETSLKSLKNQFFLKTETLWKLWKTFSNSSGNNHRLFLGNSFVPSRNIS